MGITNFMDLNKRLLLFVILLMFPLIIHGYYNREYNEIIDPTVDLTMQSMRAHQTQWSNFHFYTMNVDTPGFVEVGGYNVLNDDKLEMVPFFRWRAGPPVETDNQLDFYIHAESRGFFEVLLPTGLGYTRDGRFKLNQDRKLVMLAGGFPVLGERGEIFLPEGMEIDCSKSGMLFVDGQAVDRLRIVVFSDMSKLDTLNGSLFYLTGPAAVLEGEEYYGVQQGFIEQNNVIKALIGDITMAKNTYEGVSKVSRSVIKAMNSSAQLGNP